MTPETMKFVCPNIHPFYVEVDRGPNGGIIGVQSMTPRRWQLGDKLPFDYMGD